MRGSKGLVGCALLTLLGACTQAAGSPPRVVSAPVRTAPPAVPVTTSVRGLEAVIGQDARALTRLFGAPRLEVIEGDATKLQFAGARCILDAYLYPPAPGRDPVAAHVDARRSDGQDVDKAACVAALRQ